LPKKKLVVLEEILKQPGALAAWTKLNVIPEPDRRTVERRLETLASGTPSFDWHPPGPRDARRLAELLLKVAQRIGRMNIYFSSSLPLGNPDFRNLPKTIEKYAEALRRAAGSRRTLRQSSCEDRDRELEIVGLLEQFDPAREHHHYEDAVALIQAAYNAGYQAGLIKEKIINSESLRRVYERQYPHYGTAALSKRPR
jgi:hypothetical protein